MAIWENEVSMKNAQIRVSLALVGLVSAVWAGVDVHEGDPNAQKNIEFVNNTSNKQGIVGLRTQAAGTFALSGISSFNKLAFSNNGTNYIEGYATAAWDKAIFDVGAGQTASIPIAWGTGKSASTIPLLKTGVCNQPLPYKDADPIDLNQLGELLKSSTYYDTKPNYVDKLGLHGGDFSGGFIDTYVGETQALIAIPSGTFNVNLTPGVVYNPSSFKSAMPFMALTMGQEFFGMDLQWMFSVWTKETAFMAKSPAVADWHRSLWTNADAAFGPGEVEATTYISRAMGYPKFFPYETCLNTNANVRDVATYTVFCKETEPVFAGRYMNAAHTDPDSAYIVNATLASGLTFWFNYDLISNATCLGFKQALQQATDKRVGLCAMTPLYNLGINLGAESPLVAPKNWSTLSCNDFATGNGNYRVQITDVANLWEAEAAKPNAVYEDRMISLDDVRRFYFGENSSASQPWSADGSKQAGGLMMHFNIGDAKKKEMWEELVAAFNLQAAHWGGGKISLRYDWLSNLRIAKKYLDLKRGQIQGEEAGKWISDRSDGCTNDASGKPLDTRWPFASFGSLTDNGDFVAEVKASEVDAKDRGIESIEWTVNDDWTLFSKQNVKAVNVTDPKNTTWQITIPAADYQALTSTGQRTLYVRVNDSCGNSIVINTILKGVPKPNLSDASMYDQDGDGKADSLVFGGTDNGTALFADFTDVNYDWYGTSRTSNKGSAKSLGTNAYAILDNALGSIDESQRAGDLKITGPWGTITKGINDKVAPVIMSATLRDTKGDATAKDTLTLSLNRNISGLDTTNPKAFLNFFGKSLTLNGKAPEKISGSGSRLVVIYPLNSIKAYNPNTPLDAGDSVRLDPAGPVLGASNQLSPAANNKKVPIALDFGPLHLLPGGAHGWFDTDGDGTMDMAQLQMDRNVDDYRRDQMKLTLSWIKTAKNKVFTKTYTGSDFSFSNDLVQIKFAKSDSISPNVTYFNAQAADPLRRWGSAYLVQPNYENANDSVKMADRMGPVIVKADLKRSSAPKTRPDYLDLTFSEPLDQKATKGKSLYEFRIEGRDRTLQHSEKLTWKASGAAMQIAFTPDLLERPVVGDSVRLIVDAVDGVALDSAGNKPSTANPYRPITGKPVLQVSAVPLVGLSDEYSAAHPKAFDTLLVFDKTVNVDSMATSLGMSGFYARLTFNDVPSGVVNLSADSLKTLREAFSLRLKANIYSKLGEWVTSYDRSIGCKEIQGSAFGGDARLSGACDPSIMLSNREFTVFIPWNFRDDAGRLVGTGVYLVDLSASTTGGGKTSLETPIKIGVYRGLKN